MPKVKSKPAKAQQPQSKFDRFFSESMEHLPIARAFFKQHLPVYVLALIDLDTLRRLDRTKTHEKLDQRRRDIVYVVKMKDGRLLLFCVEHQSSADLTMPLRFMHYNADTLVAYLKKYKEIPLIINCLFYHGPRPYPHHNTLQAYYSQPELGVNELTLRFHLADCTQIRDQEFLRHGHCAPMSLLLKHGRDGNFELEPAAYRNVFEACVTAIGDGYIDSMLNYAVTLTKVEAGERIFNFVDEVLINKTDIIMTYGQVLRNEGMERGIEQGLEQGIERGIAQERIKIAGRMLYNGAPLEQVQQWTGVSEAEVKYCAKQR